MAMKEILFNGKTYPVIDETPTHYVTPPFNCREGYHFISKNRATVVTKNVNNKEDK